MSNSELIPREVDTFDLYGDFEQQGILKEAKEKRERNGQILSEIAEKAGLESVPGELRRKMLDLYEVRSNPMNFPGGLANPHGAGIEDAAIELNKLMDKKN